VPKKLGTHTGVRGNRSLPKAGTFYRRKDLVGDSPVFGYPARLIRSGLASLNGIAFGLGCRSLLGFTLGRNAAGLTPAGLAIGLIARGTMWAALSNRNNGVSPL